MGEGGFKNPEKLPTSFMDDPLANMGQFLNFLEVLTPSNNLQVIFDKNSAFFQLFNCWAFTASKPLMISDVDKEALKCVTRFPHALNTLQTLYLPTFFFFVQIQKGAAKNAIVRHKATLIFAKKRLG